MLLLLVEGGRNEQVCWLLAPPLFQTVLCVCIYLIKWRTLGDFLDADGDSSTTVSREKERGLRKVERTRGSWGMESVATPPPLLSGKKNYSPDDFLLWERETGTVFIFCVCFFFIKCFQLPNAQPPRIKVSNVATSITDLLHNITVPWSQIIQWNVAHILRAFDCDWIIARI
jgi:hypothetical protein